MSNLRPDPKHYEPNVNYFFGLPRSIKPGGVMFDIPLVKINATDDGIADKLKQFNLQTGILSSALEYAVPEQMFVNEQNPGEAISAVKALQKASAAGQRIYHITQANQATILPNIHHHPDTMDEIKNALNADKEVITHTDTVSVPGWSGAGYIITDPDTGAGIFIGLGIVAANAIIAGATLLYFIPLIISMVAVFALYELTNSLAEFATGAGVALGVPLTLIDISIGSVIALILGIASMVA